MNTYNLEFVSVFLHRVHATVLLSSVMKADIVLGSTCQHLPLTSLTLGIYWSCSVHQMVNRSCETITELE